MVIFLQVQDNSQTVPAALQTWQGRNTTPKWWFLTLLRGIATRNLAETPYLIPVPSRSMQGRPWPLPPLLPGEAPSRLVHVGARLSLQGRVIWSALQHQNQHMQVTNHTINARPIILFGLKNA